MDFTVGDRVVWNGSEHLVRSIDDGICRLLNADGEYVLVAKDMITEVYWD